MRFEGEIEYRYCHYPAKALKDWKDAVAQNRRNKKEGKTLVSFSRPWMPHSPYYIHCRLASPHLIVPQQTTRFYPGWFVGQMDRNRP